MKKKNYLKYRKIFKYLNKRISLGVRIIISLLFIVGLSFGLYNLEFLTEWYKVRTYPGLREYYISSSNLKDVPDRLMDDRKIVLAELKGELHYHPVAISKYAQDNFEVWLHTSKRKYYDGFIRHADYLVENQVLINNNFGVWYYDFDWPFGGMKAPWVSAMAQGKAVSVLVRAWQLTGDNKYFDSATKAVESFNYDIKEGGVREKKEDLVYYEEYPKLIDTENYSSFLRSTGSSEHTLNGFIFSLFGLYDYYLATGDQKVKKNFDIGLNTLKNDLDSYDLGVISAYDQSSFSLKISKLDFYNQTKDLEISKLKLIGTKTGSCAVKADKGEQKSFICKNLLGSEKVRVFYSGREDVLLKVTINAVPWVVWSDDIRTIKGSFKMATFSLPKDLLTRRVPTKYHNLHIKQLDALCSLTKDGYFCEVANKWRNYKIGFFNPPKDFVFPNTVDTSTGVGGFIAERIFNRFRDYYESPLGLGDIKKLWSIIREEFSKPVI